MQICYVIFFIPNLNEKKTSKNFAYLTIPYIFAFAHFHDYCFYFRFSMMNMLRNMRVFSCTLRRRHDEEDEWDRHCHQRHLV